MHQHYRKWILQRITVSCRKGVLIVWQENQDESWLRLLDVTASLFMKCSKRCETLPEVFARVRQYKGWGKTEAIFPFFFPIWNKISERFQAHSVIFSVVTPPKKQNKKKTAILFEVRNKTFGRNML